MEKSNQPYFDAQSYREHRPFYPASIFRMMRPQLKELMLEQQNPVLLDLACGTGQSFASFLNAFAGNVFPCFAIDADPSMLELAQAWWSKSFSNIEFREGRAEAIPLPDQSVNVVLVGSAIHWFDVPRASIEIARVLKPNGIFLCFEYQFPKCMESTEFNDWIRRSFNLEWTAPIQTPRGKLKELLAPFVENTLQWQELGRDFPEWIESMNAEQFLGHLFSQSRVVHAEARAVSPEQFRASIQRQVGAFFSATPQGVLTFNFKPRVLMFKRM